MAFFNRKMMENKSLMKAWRAAHLKILHDDENICLPEICDEIAQWVRRDRRPRNRLSLRSFSAVLSGATRLYSRQVNLLLKDTFNCSISIWVTHRPVLPAVEKLPSDTITSTNGSQSDSTECIPDDTKSSATDEFHGSSSSDLTDESTVYTVTPNSNQQITGAREKSEGRRDQQIQTSPIPGPGNIGGFDPNLPFGYIIIHDNYHSRIPSKILCSNLSENVKFLPTQKPMN